MEKIALEKLNPCPIRVTIHTEKMLEQIAMTAKADFESIPPIAVADVNGNYYIVDGHTRVEGCRRVGVTELQARIKKVERIEDVILWHIRLNRHSTFNPLVLYQVLKNEDTPEEEIAGKYWLDVSLVRTVLTIQNFSDEAYHEASKRIESIAKKYSTVFVPQYVIEAIARAPKEQQLAVMQYAFINLNEPEHKFSYRTYDDLEYMLSMYELKERDPAVFERDNHEGAGSVKNEESVAEGHERSDEIVATTKRVPTATREEAKQIIGSVPHLAFLKCECGREYVVNRKTLTISPVEHKDDVISIKGDRGMQFFAMPIEIAQYLELQEGDKIRCYPFSSGSKEKERVLKKLEQLKDGAKAAVIIQEGGYIER